MHIRLPDLLADWPFPPTLNPHYSTICEESTKWTESYHPFDAKSQAAFNRSGFDYLTALAYPDADPEYFRAAIDLMNFYFVFDDLSDKADGTSARALSDEIKDAFSDPSKPRPPGESVLGEMAKSFWSRALQIANHSSAQRFVRVFGAYTDAVAVEASDRELERVRTIDDYFNLRRTSIGVRTMLSFFLLRDNLPEEVILHPCIERLTHGAIDLSILTNDIYSYDKEQGLRDPHNMLTVIMHELGMDAQQAMDYSGKQFRTLAQQYLEDMKHVPTFSEPVNIVVAKYVQRVTNWIAADIEWSLSSERYFGSKAGQEIKSQLVIELRRPKIRATHGDE